MGLFPFISSWIGRKNDKKKEPQRGLGVYSFKSKVYLYYTAKKSNVKFNVAESTDGFCFERTKKNQYLDGPRDIETYISKYHNFKISHISENSKNFSLYFQCISGSEKHQYLAYSNNLSHWTVSKTIKDFTETGALVSGYTYKKQFVMYYGEKNIHIAYSDNDYDWKTEKNPILTPRKNSFDNSEIEIQNAILTEKGVLIVYHSRSKRSNYVDYKIGLALFDAQNPSKLLWRSNEPVWDSTHEWRNKHISPIGVVLFQEKCISYWDIEGEGIYAVVYSFYKLHIPSITQHVSLNLKKSNSNPMISPNNNNWESFNTFNPATIYEGGKVHILYRAQGYNYVSTIGYATSNDGTTIDERLNYPVFTPDDHLKINKPIYNSQPNTNPYSSGGGFGGCEDPRITKIDDRIYMMYVANDGSLPRLALTSISVEDFLNRNWLWEKPILISPPGVVDKSGCILPEKINGKYVIFHRIFPDILIDYVDDLNFTGDSWLKGEHKIEIRKNMWDSRKIGAGAPPIKTKDGWLLIYYAVDDKDASKYKVGAMLLDLKDPTKVLHRTNAPILEPKEQYENEGFKPGIAYPCGAVVIKETLFVYYGGADSVVCVATANLDQFLAELKYSEIAKLSPAIIRRVL